MYMQQSLISTKMIAVHIHECVLIYVHYIYAHTYMNIYAYLY